jgi:hypothetical protein
MSTTYYSYGEKIFLQRGRDARGEDSDLAHQEDGEVSRQLECAPC